jgi:hypothetical protein
MAVTGSPSREGELDPNGPRSARARAALADAQRAQGSESTFAPGSPRSEVLMIQILLRSVPPCGAISVLPLAAVSSMGCLAVRLSDTSSHKRSTSRIASLNLQSKPRILCGLPFSLEGQQRARWPLAAGARCLSAMEPSFNRGRKYKPESAAFVPYQRQAGKARWVRSTSEE